MRQRKNGFTLVELLVVIGVIAVSIGLLLPALSRARKTAYETRSISNLRQMLLGYAFYMQDNHGLVPWGYPGMTVDGAAVTVYDPGSRQTFTDWPMVSRYPWRILKYVGNMWEIIHGHDTLPPLTLSTDNFSVADGKAYTLSLTPTYGVNSVYIGGDFDRGQGFVGPPGSPPGTPGDHPNTGKHIVFKACEVRHPTDLIVFADCQQNNSPNSGFARLIPPQIGPYSWWSVDNDKVVPVTLASTYGIPKGWFTNRVVTGFFDGHVEALQPSDMTDMRKWANKATTPNYDYTLAN